MKRGFTLIELLAVIVILAIIAVIAVPIVLNIIDETKNNAGLRSAEMYIDAVEMSVAQSTLKNKNIQDGTYNIKNGDICLNNTCTEILKVEVNGEVPKRGTITIKKGQIEDISLNIETKVIGKNNEGEISYLNKLTDICELKNASVENKISAGDKYECKVKAGTKYTFYVLNTINSSGEIIAESSTDKIVVSINLIMDQNINSDGTPAGMTGTKKNGDNVYNLVAWVSKDDYGELHPYDEETGCYDEDGCALNDRGPITAMTFLYNATKAWTNIEPLNYIYNNREYQELTDDSKIGYASFISREGVLKITSLDETIITTIGTKDVPLRARMPIYSGVWNSDRTGKTTEKGEVADFKNDNSNAYLYDYLDLNAQLFPYGYWTLSADTSGSAWAVYHDRLVENIGIRFDGGFGVRPVITLKL